MRVEWTIAVAFFQLALGCQGHSKVGGSPVTPRPQPVDRTPREEWHSAISAHMNMCRTLRLCRVVTTERPCTCEGEEFPCKEFDFDDGPPGCQVRLSCIRVASGDSAAPAIEAPVLCGKFGEDWRAKASEDDELQRRFIATVPGTLGADAWPATCDAAARLVLVRFDADLRATLRRMSRQELIRFHHGWGRAIRNGLGMWRGNTALVRSCSGHHEDEPVFPDNASMSLIEAIWQRLQAEEQIGDEQPNKPLQH